MSKNCGHSVPCGCGDRPLSTPAPCTECDTSGGNQCAEMFCQDCVLFCQPDMKVYNTEDVLVFEIDQGMTWTEILQYILLRSAAPTCIDSAPLGLSITNIQTTTISLKWTADAATQYRVTWDDGVTINTVTLAAGVGTYTITGLTSDTIYSVKVNNVSTGCDSVTFQPKTL